MMMGAEGLMGVAGMEWWVYHVNTGQRALADIPITCRNQTWKARAIIAQLRGYEVRSRQHLDSFADRGHTFVAELGGITACANNSEIRRREEGSSSCLCSHFHRLMPSYGNWRVTINVTRGKICFGWSRDDGMRRAKRASADSARSGARRYMNFQCLIGV